MGSRTRMDGSTCGNWWLDWSGVVLRYWLWERRGGSISSVFKEMGVKLVDSSVRITSEAFLCVDKYFFLAEGILALSPCPCPCSYKTIPFVRNIVVIRYNNIK